MTNPNWRQIHGEDFCVPPTIEAVLKDASEPNDACPKFELSVPDFVITVYSDHPIPKLREAGGKRFSVTISFYEGEHIFDTINLLLTDDDNEVIQLLSMIKEAQQ
jgi:hypothetical protein